MKVEEAIAMLRALPPGSEIDIVIRSIVTPASERPAKRAPGRWANTTPEERRAAAQRASEARWQATRGDPSLSHGDASVDASVTDVDASGVDGGNQGGSGSEKAEKSGKETGIPGSSLPGQDQGAPASGASMRQLTHSGDALTHDASVKRRRRTPAATTTALPDPFPLTAEHRVHAAKKGWPTWWLEDRHEAFCGTAKAKGWRYVDWTAALYTYLRNEIGWGRGPEQMAHLAPKGLDRAARPVRQPFLERQEAERRAAHERAAREAEERGEPAQRDLALLRQGIGEA